MIINAIDSTVLHETDVDEKAALVFVDDQSYELVGGGASSTNGF